MQRVCIFCETWASGGIESFLTNILTRIDLSKIEVDIVVIRLEDSIFTKRLSVLGVRFYELAGDRKLFKENRREFKKLLALVKYDAIHVNTFHGGALYFLHLAKEADIPLRIAHSHNTGLRRTKSVWLKWMIHEGAKYLFVNDATDFWACSTAAAEFLFFTGKRNYPAYRIIPNGIDIQRFRFDSKERDIIRDRLDVTGRTVVGNVGRLCSQKNQMFLLNVFAVFQRGCPDSSLLLVGDGEDREALEQEARELRIEDKTIFHTTSEHVERLLWSMDLFVFPSCFEGLGIAMVEAQAAGLPVLCSDRIPKEASVLPFVTRLSLEEGPEKWANALSSCIGLIKDREVCAKLVQNGGFDVDEVAKDIEKVYLHEKGT